MLAPDFLDSRKSNMFCLTYTSVQKLLEAAVHPSELLLFELTGVPNNNSVSVRFADQGQPSMWSSFASCHRSN